MTNSYRGAWNISRVGAYGVTGGGMGVLSGQGFQDGAMFAGGTAFSRYTYNRWVGFDATWEPGGETQSKGRFTMPYACTNNVGPQFPGEFCHEGSSCSIFLNKIPLINPTAGAHDAFQVRIDSWLGGGALGAFARDGPNWPSMIPAAGFTFSALLASPGGMLMYFR